MNISVSPTFSTLLNGSLLQDRLTEHHQWLCLTRLTLAGINTVLTLITLSFGLASWILLPKWRRIQHYVFLNMALAAYLHLVGVYLYVSFECSTGEVIIFMVLSRTIMGHVLLVTTVMFYVELVKVFNIDTSRKYLKVNLIIWVLPCFEVSTAYAIDCYFKTSITVILHYVINSIFVSITIGLCLKVNYDLIVKMGVKKPTSREICTMIFRSAGGLVTSGLTTLLPMMILELVHADLKLYLIARCMAMVTVAGGHVVFLSLKPHRELWAEFWHKRGAGIHV